VVLLISLIDMIASLPTPKDRILYLTSQINQDVSATLTKSIIDICDDDKYLSSLYQIHNCKYNSNPIKIYIDSYGGNSYQMLTLMSIIEKSSTPIHTIVTGCAMSAGFMIAISGHKRFAYNMSTFMYHQMSTIVYGKLEDIKNDVVECERITKIVEDYVIKRTNITKKELKHNFEFKKDWYFSAKDALKYGIIDEII